jgi:hypothetical protein
VGRSRPSDSAISAVTAWPEAPSHGRTTRPPDTAPRSTAFTMLTGIAKPMPSEPPVRVKMAVLIPTSLPSMSISAPPELPGLIAASVWMKERKSPGPILVLARAETMPLVTVWPTPKGLPTARTKSPTSSSSESPKESEGSSSPRVSILSTARSVRSSAPNTWASNSRRSARATVISSAPSITWLLVTMSPASSTFVHDHARSQGVLDALLRWPTEGELAAEETAEKRVVE